MSNWRVTTYDENEEVIETIKLSSISWQLNQIIDLTLNVPENAIKQQYSF